jgi:hypothetical protein
MIETAPLEQAADAYARMMQGKARFGMVLVTKDGDAQSAPVSLAFLPLAKSFGRWLHYTG